MKNIAKYYMKAFAAPRVFIIFVMSNSICYEIITLS